MTIPESPVSLHCIEIVLSTPDEALADVVEGCLWELDVHGIEREDDETWTELVEDPRPKQPGTIRWRLHMDGALPGDEVLAEVRSVLPEDERVRATMWERTDMSFLTAWKEFFRPTQVSPRFWVHPPWERPDVGEEMHRIEIDPGMAFGTGTHETTRLCLVALDRALATPGLRVLDVGTGSGILAIGAALLGASEVMGTENDPVATRIAQENSEINGTEGVCRFATCELPTVEGTWDVVVANILPHVLIEMRDDLVRLAGDDGTIILSGILQRERDRVLASFGEVITQDARVDTMGEWCSITYARG